MRLLIVGASGHARVLIDLVECLGGIEIVGLIAHPSREPVDLGYPILGDDEAMPAIAANHGADAVFVAVGDNATRQRIAADIMTRVPYLRTPSLIHPSAVVARRVTIAPHAVVMAGAVVQVGSSLGEGVIINTCASVDHDCELGAFSSVAPGAHLGGRVRIGEGSAVSLGAAVLHNRSVGSHTVVGSGAVVARDLPDGVVAYGIPARIIRPRTLGERYL